MNNFQNQIHYWAHMLDETKHQSYYDVYMQANPKDKMPIILDVLVGEFAEDLKKQRFDWLSIQKNGIVHDDLLDEAQANLKFHYNWNLIPAQTYAAIITRYIAMMDAARGQRYLSELDYSDVRRGVSRKVIEECLDIICHNTNVLEANNYIVLDERIGFKGTSKIFQKYGMPKLKQYSNIFGEYKESYHTVVELYKAWASYASSRLEPYICDTDNGVIPLKKILNSCEYDADEIELITTLNKAIDVVHLRSDLATAFLEGGQKTAALVSNLPKEFVV